MHPSPPEVLGATKGGPENETETGFQVAVLVSASMVILKVPHSFTLPHPQAHTQISMTCGVRRPMDTAQTELASPHSFPQAHTQISLLAH